LKDLTSDLLTLNTEFHTVEKTLVLLLHHDLGKLALIILGVIRRGLGSRSRLLDNLFLLIISREHNILIVVIILINDLDILLFFIILILTELLISLELDGLLFNLLTLNLGLLELSLETLLILFLFRLFLLSRPCPCSAASSSSVFSILAMTLSLRGLRPAH